MSWNAGDGFMDPRIVIEELEAFIRVYDRNPPVHAPSHFAKRVKGLRDILKALQDQQAEVDRSREPVKEHYGESVTQMLAEWQRSLFPQAKVMREFLDSLNIPVKGWDQPSVSIDVAAAEDEVVGRVLRGDGKGDRDAA